MLPFSLVWKRRFHTKLFFSTTSLVTRQCELKCPELYLLVHDIEDSTNASQYCKITFVLFQKHVRFGLLARYFENGPEQTLF